MVSTHLKNISQNGNLPQIGVKIENVWNHHLEYGMSGIKQADSVSMSYQVNVGGKRPPEVKHRPEKPGPLFF